MKWRRVLVIAGLVIVTLLVPLSILIIQNWLPLTRLFSMYTAASKHASKWHYEVVSDTPGYTVSLKDTAYLDYITAQYNIFADNGVIDLAANRGKREVKKRYTVDSIRIKLVPKLGTYILALEGNEFFAGYGTYDVKDRTLIIQIALDFNDSALKGHPKAAEEMFLDVLYQTLYFAHGIEVGSHFTDKFEANKKDIKDFLRTGVFKWPIVIEK